jgi:hypothetical protein
MTDKVFYIQGYNTPDDKVFEYLDNGYTVYNAPRPLLGHELWQGDFRHGIFYAAVAPDDLDEFGDAPTFHKRNRELDGYTCEIITKEAVMAYGVKVAEEYNRNLADFEYDDIVKSFVGWLGRQ